MATYMDVHGTGSRHVSLLMPRAVHSICELHAYEEHVLAQEKRIARQFGVYSGFDS